MRIAAYLLILSVVVMLFGCSSLRYVEFDIVRPPKILLPDTAPVVVVHNIKETKGSNELFSDTISSDTLEDMFMDMMVSGMNHSGYIQDIETYKSYNPTGQPLDTKAAVMLTDSLGGKPFISLNSVTVDPQLTIYTLDDDWNISVLRYVTNASITVVTPDDYIPVSFMCVDTMEWQGSGYTPESAEASLPPAEKCLREALQRLSNIVETQYIPYRDKVGRIYFVSFYPLMKDADKYWKDGKYDEASYLWEYVYENSSRRQLQAHAAANMAMYEELNDRYEQALMWARIAYSLFCKQCNVYDPQIAYLSDYIRQLKDREKERAFFIDKNINHF